MADTTNIEWTDATWQIITGCSVVSPGCTNCYAMKLAGTRLKHHPSRKGLTDEVKPKHHVWNGQVRFNEQWLEQPLRWKRPRRIFVCAHGDLFHENVPDEWIDEIFGVMAVAAQKFHGPGDGYKKQHDFTWPNMVRGPHTFQVLTKRPERMRSYMASARRRVAAAAHRHAIDRVCAGGLSDSIHNGTMWPLPNVWLGVSVEDQKRADERIPLLLDTPAALRFISAEPLLGPVDILPWLRGTCCKCGQRTVAIDKACTHCGCPVGTGPALGWVIAGGESGPGSRPMHPDWVRSMRDQCATAGASFFFKQWGDWHPDALLHREVGTQVCPPPSMRVGKKAAGAMIDGREYREMPEVHNA